MLKPDGSPGTFDDGAKGIMQPALGAYGIELRALSRKLMARQEHHMPHPLSRTG